MLFYESIIIKPKITNKIQGPNTKLNEQETIYLPCQMMSDRRGFEKEKCFFTNPRSLLIYVLQEITLFNFTGIFYVYITDYAMDMICIVVICNMGVTCLCNINELDIPVFCNKQHRQN